MGRSAKEELFSQGKNFLLIPIIFILAIIAIPLIVSSLSLMGFKTVMIFRHMIVNSLKDIKINLVLATVDLGGSMISTLQKFLGKTPPPNIYDFDQTIHVCTSSNEAECDIDRISINGDSVDFVIDESNALNLNEGTKNYLVPKDLLLEYPAGGTPRVVKGEIGLLEYLYSRMSECYSSAHMEEEGDPFYKAEDYYNPHLCAVIDINLTDFEGETSEEVITLKDFNDFIRNTVDSKTGEYYSDVFKQLQLSYCFDTTTCLRTSRLDSSSIYGRVCIPETALDGGGDIEISVGAGFLGAAFTVGGAVIGSIGGPVGAAIGAGVGAVVGEAAVETSTMSTITCEIAVLKPHFESTALNNKLMLIYYWDDNGQSTLTLGDQPIRATILRECNGAFVMSSTYSDPFERKIDPLLICLVEKG